MVGYQVRGTVIRGGVESSRTIDPPQKKKREKKKKKMATRPRWILKEETVDLWSDQSA